MTLFCDTFPTPFGPFTIAVNETGAVTGSAFGDLTKLRARLRDCHPIGDKAAAAATATIPGASRTRSQPLVNCQLVDNKLRSAPARQQVLAYFAGRRREFALQLAPPGTPFQQSVWALLRAIPYGETRTYGQIATQLGNPGAARAVGRANATNPICVIVPCHRVIGASGALTGFAFGNDLKRRLLELEDVRSSPQRPYRL